MIFIYGYKNFVEIVLASNLERLNGYAQGSSRTLNFFEFE